MNFFFVKKTIALSVPSKGDPGDLAPLFVFADNDSISNIFCFWVKVCKCVLQSTHKNYDVTLNDLKTCANDHHGDAIFLQKIT